VWPNGGAVPETQEDRDKRFLEELKGKNIAHYSVLLSAWIQTRMERDKTLVTLSLAGVGFLITIVNVVGLNSNLSAVLFAVSFLGFMLTIWSSLEIYERNAKHLERELRGAEATRDQKPLKLEQFDKLSKWAFLIAALCAIFGGTISAGSKYMAIKVSQTTNKPTQEQQQSDTSSEHLHSIQGVETLRPQLQTQTPEANPPQVPVNQPTQSSSPNTEKPK
jgi:hypothetical protein